MGSIRKFIWRIIWLFSFCTLGITVIYKDGVVIKLESIWGEVAPLPHRQLGSKEAQTTAFGHNQINPISLACSVGAENKRL